MIDTRSSTRARFRRIVRVSTSPTTARAAVEDDFHHFRVTLFHRDGLVRGIDHETVRHPWTLCPLAGAELARFVGMPLASSLATALAQGAVREHCTHLYDLACLAMSSAARAVVERRFTMDVDDRLEGRTTASLRRNDGLSLDWRVDGTTIIGPAPFAGVSVKRDFPQWAALSLPVDQAEAAILLRRAVFVSGGRRRDLDLATTAADGARNLGGCFVMRPGVAEHALRVKGASRDFSDVPDGPMAEGW